MSVLLALSLAVGQTMSYPPTEVPAYIVCKFPKGNESGGSVAAEGVALYFPSGISGTADRKIVDQHRLLGGRSLDFDIRGEKHWSLYAKEGRPSPDPDVSFALTFVPTSKKGGLYDAALSEGKDIKRTGYCLGLIGPDAAKVFQRAVDDPKSLDVMK